MVLVGRMVMHLPARVMHRLVHHEWWSGGPDSAIRSTPLRHARSRRFRTGPWESTPLALARWRPDRASGLPWPSGAGR